MFRKSTDPKPQANALYRSQPRNALPQAYQPNNRPAYTQDDASSMRSQNFNISNSSLLSDASSVSFPSFAAHRNASRQDLFMRSASSNSFPEPLGTSLKETHLTFFRTHSLTASEYPSTLNTLTSVTSMEGIEDLKALESRMALVVECERVGFEDSTTGAHIGMSKEQESLYIIKSNSESHFELIGNCIADVLDLNIPGFAFLSEDFIQYNRFKKMLDSRHECALIASEYLCAINLKEVTPGADVLNTEALFQELGKAFFLDWVIGNWDRFPVFENDTEGNYGNLMYLPFEKQLLFIDTVAQKHTEAGGYGTEAYFKLLQNPKKIAHNIQAWLAVKFPEITSMDHELIEKEFSLGIQGGLDMLQVRRKDIKAILNNQLQQLENAKSKHLSKEQQMLSQLAEEVKVQHQLIKQSTIHASDTDFEKLLNTLTTDQSFNSQDIAILSQRLKQGRGIPKIGTLAIKTNQCKPFMSAWKCYSEKLLTASAMDKLSKINKQLSQLSTEEPIDLEAIVDDLAFANFKGESLVKLNHYIKTLEEIHEQVNKIKALKTLIGQVTKAKTNPLKTA